MTAPEFFPFAPWITWADVQKVCTPPALDVSLQAPFCQAVSELMWMLSGRQFGTATIKARPVGQCGHGVAGGYPYWYGGVYWSGYGPSGPCSCGAYRYVHLGQAPIVSVTKVEIDGVTLDPAAYKVDEWNYLVRVDGDPWPSCNDLAAASDAKGVFEVTWVYGVPVPQAGLTSAALLACRLAPDLNMNAACAPPGNASTVAAEGVTIQLNNSSIIEEGRTGIALVDFWLGGVNPDGFKAGSGFFDPGARAEWFRTGT